MILTSRGLADRELRQISRTGTMPTRSNSLRAMMENSASPLPPATAPITAVDARDQPGHRRRHHGQPALGKVEPGQQLAGGDGVAGLGQDFRHLQPRPLRAHRRLLARDQDAGNLDDVGEAGLCGLEHGDRGAPGRALGRLLGGEGGGGEGEQGGERREEQVARSGGCGEIFHRQYDPVSGAIDIRRRLGSQCPQIAHANVEYEIAVGFESSQTLASYEGTLSMPRSAGGTASRNRHFMEIGASPSQETKSTSPQ